MPFCKNRGWHLDVTAQSFRGMAAQKQPVKKRRFALRILQIHRRNSWHELYGRSHEESAVYRKAFARQVVLQGMRCVPSNTAPSCLNPIGIRCGKLKQGYMP